MEKTTTPHRKAYLLAGFVVSNLVLAFVLAFFFPFFWAIDPPDSNISLVFFGTIFMVTLCAAIASYFWSVGNIPLRNIRSLAVPNASLIWFLYVAHPRLGSDWFFIVFAAIIVIFCSFLGTWFGRRFFYE